MRVPTLLGVTAAAALAVAVPASAGTVHDVDVIAHGLDNPRHVAVSSDGAVYVAEAGRGGDHVAKRSCFDSAEGFACTGATGAVTKVSAAPVALRPGARARRPRVVRSRRREQRDRSARRVRVGPRRVRDERRPDGADPRHPARGRAPRPDARRRRAGVAALRHAAVHPQAPAARRACSPTCGASRRRTTRTPRWATRSSTATRSTCTRTARASSWRTPAATACCASRTAGGSASSRCSRTSRRRTRSAGRRSR